MKPKGLYGFSTCSKLSQPTQPQLPRFMTRGATSFILHPLNFNRLHFPSITTTTTTSLTISNSSSSSSTTTSRRLVLLTPLLATGASFLLSSSASFSKADEAKTNSTPTPPPPSLSLEEEEAGIGWRIYDATAIGEPMAVGKEKRRVVWEKVMNARIVYLGEAEQVPTKDDKFLELEILMGLTKRCVESAKSVSLALEAFPSDLQPQLDQFLDKR